MIGLLETIIDRMADILEIHSAEVERISAHDLRGGQKGSPSSRSTCNNVIKDIGREGNHFSHHAGKPDVSVSRMVLYF
ncbi:MAG: hypothetical protein MZV70_28645 [Desulfobacterales bacterium]|nr:hypothetical protein [Desulfobacterales bacterium]